MHTDQHSVSEGGAPLHWGEGVGEGGALGGVIAHSGRQSEPEEAY